MCACVFSVHVSGVCCHTCVSPTNGCAFVHFVVQYTVWQGSPASRRQAGTCLWLLRNRAAWQKARSGQVSRASAIFLVAPHFLHYHLSCAIYQISGGIRISQERRIYCA